MVENGWENKVCHSRNLAESSQAVRLPKLPRFRGFVLMTTALFVMISGAVLLQWQQSALLQREQSSILLENRILFSEVEAAMGILGAHLAQSSRTRLEGRAASPPEDLTSVLTEASGRFSGWQAMWRLELLGGGSGDTVLLLVVTPPTPAQELHVEGLLRIRESSSEEGWPLPEEGEDGEESEEAPESRHWLLPNGVRLPSG